MPAASSPAHAASRNLAAPSAETAPTAPTAGDVRAARERIAGKVLRTPFTPAARLSTDLGAEIWLKLECLQHTGAFKERGALNKLLTMSETDRARGVIAASAGNHAQGLAYHASRLGVTATIVMPVTTPDVKIRQTRNYGAHVVLHGATFDEARSEAERRSAETGALIVHPFDDAAIIAGQGTLALEMIEDGPALDAILVPIGGGGLLAGMALAFRDASPDTEIIGVQTELFPSMKNALDGGARPVGGNTLAEGIAVKEAGQLTRKVIGESVDDIVLVDERTLERALSLLMNDQKILSEGAGAAGLAAIMCDPARFADKRVGLVICGGNIDQRLLSMILMRDLARSGRLARLRVQLLDMPGQLVRVAGIIARQDGNVVDVGHHRTYSDLPAKMTCMDVTIDTQGQDHLDRIIADLRSEGYAVDIAAY